MGDPEIIFQGDAGWKKGEPVLIGLDLKIKRGKLICVLGPNGSGKTTLLLTLSKAIPPLNGRITYMSDDIKPVYIPPYPVLPPTFSIGTVISYYLKEQRGITPIIDEERLERVISLLKLAGVDYDLGREFRRLSTGEAQKTVLFSILVSDRNALFLDEPNSHLDLKSRLILYHLLKKTSRKKIVVVSLHDVNEASLNCEEIILLGHRKKIVAKGQVDSCLTTKNLEIAYNIKFKSIVSKEENLRFFVPYEEVQLLIRDL